MSAVITFGEIMLRLTTPGHQRFVQAPHLEITFGGAEANVAAMISGLGGRAEFITRLPENEIAQRAIDELRRLRVGVDRIVRGGDRIGVYFLEQGVSQRPGRVIYDRAGSAIASAKPHDFDWDKLLAGAAWFHWSGITPALSPSMPVIVQEACMAARRQGLTVSFDMNYRGKLWDTSQAGSVLMPLMEHVDLCICGAEEARAVLGVEGNSKEETVRALESRYSFKMVAMTERAGASASQTRWGAIFSSGGSIVESPQHQIDVVDRVGAGDSFTGALIFSMMRGDAVQTAIDFAAAAGALKHTIPGDFNLVSLAEVEALAAGTGGGRVQR